MKTVLVDLNCGLIQTIRMVHAIAEDGCELVIRPEDTPKFASLQKKFGMQYREGKIADSCLSEYVSVSHRQPETSVGAIVRPLIFPREIVAACHRSWSATRRYRFLFCGLLTPGRRSVISGWLTSQFHLSSAETLIALLRMRFARKRIRVRGNRGQELFVEASERGRTFPEKSWDSQYWATLAESQFVLCPSGDMVWTYRFFEAALCGAIPVIEEYCPLYAGFDYLTFSSTADSAVWSAESAEKNFMRCSELLSVPAGQLKSELARLSDSRSGTKGCAEA